MSRFHAEIEPPSVVKPAYWFLFQRFGLLIATSGERYEVPVATTEDELPVPLVRSQFLGYLDNNDERMPCFSGELSADVKAPAGMEYLSLRQLYGRMDEVLLALAGRAVQIVDWDRTHQYCGRCGTVVEQVAYERAKKCPSCALTTYPRISPAIIVSVERRTADGPQLLLARNNRHPSGFFSVLAGFVEPGESLESCVRREVREEVGIEVKNIRYFGSQPWPFPNSLMIAFTAEYGGGEIELEEEEIAEAAWFRPAELPQVPPPVSIARQLIDSFVARNEDVQQSS